jgi:hypothetical protein
LRGFGVAEQLGTPSGIARTRGRSKLMEVTDPFDDWLRFDRNSAARQDLTRPSAELGCGVVATHPLL